jgi:hypothetical protein
MNHVSCVWLVGGALTGNLLTIFAVAFLLFMGLLCTLLLWKMWTGHIKLDTILEEANGDASVSRFQFLLFSLIVAVGVFLFIVDQLRLPDIPPSILVLIGISASTYAVGKGISYSRPEGVARAEDADAEIPDAAAPPPDLPAPPDPANPAPPKA